MEALKKMSAKSILGNTKRFIPMDDKRDIIPGERVPLFRVFGLARGAKKGDGDNGPWLAFLGEFRATRIDAESGEVITYGSSTLFLPSCAEELLAPVVMENDGSGVEFAFDIGLIGSPASSVGYEFTADSVLAVKESEAIQSLASRLPPPKHLRLSAPKGESAGSEAQQADGEATPGKATQGKGKPKQETATA